MSYRVRLPHHPFPVGFTPQPGQCTFNASELEGWEGTRYAEGMARGPGEEWTQHAWVIHPDGYVIDPTWDDANDTFEYRENTRAWNRDNNLFG